MSAQKLDINVYDNDTLTLTLTLKQGSTLSPAVAATLPPLNLTGHHALLQVRRPDGALVSEISTPGLAGHTGAGIALTDPANGILTLTFAPSFVTLELLTLRLVDYDLLLINPAGAPHRVMFGKLGAYRGVSRVN